VTSTSAFLRSALEGTCSGTAGPGLSYANGTPLDPCTAPEACVDTVCSMTCTTPGSSCSPTSTSSSANGVCGATTTTTIQYACQSSFNLSQICASSTIQPLYYLNGTLISQCASPGLCANNICSIPCSGAGSSCSLNDHPSGPSGICGFPTSNGLQAICKPYVNLNGACAGYRTPSLHDASGKSLDVCAPPTNCAGSACLNPCTDQSTPCSAGTSSQYVAGLCGSVTTTGTQNFCRAYVAPDEQCRTRSTYPLFINGVQTDLCNQTAICLYDRCVLPYNSFGAMCDATSGSPLNSIYSSTIGWYASTQMDGGTPYCSPTIPAGSSCAGIGNWFGNNGSHLDPCMPPAMCTSNVCTT